MIDITAWTNNFLQTLNETFANRVWFVGLQGSYGRDEATETSLLFFPIYAILIPRGDYYGRKQACRSIRRFCDAF